MCKGGERVKGFPIACLMINNLTRHQKFKPPTNGVNAAQGNCYTHENAVAQVLNLKLRKENQPFLSLSSEEKHTESHV